MTGGSLGLRSGSYGSLQQHVQSGLSPIQTTPPLCITRKPPKMLKEKERLLHWFFKFAGRKKMGMLFLCAISAAVFVWVIYVGKGDDVQDGESLHHIRVNGSFPLMYPEPSPIDGMHRRLDQSSSVFKAAIHGGIIRNSSPPPTFFKGYNLPPGHPCATFVLPPPPTDRKRTGPRPCPVCYLSIDEVISLMPKEPSPSPLLSNLTYIHDDKSTESEFGGSLFGGYPTLKQRNHSYDIKPSMTVHCGFVRGEKPGRGTGFDMDSGDLLAMEQCHGIVVASAIFGNYDMIQQPKNMSEAAKNDVCFFMFVDENTTTESIGSDKKVGLWRIVLVRNLPYLDARRNGKVPKLLLHRIFVNAKYSIWIDGKLELVVDPYRVLERFLWRENRTFAISRHYRRFDVFEEAEANKAGRKYDNSSIDFQIEFYRKEGLTPYTNAKLPITSDVPEGCVIIREHTPLTNLFTCLWFNEVDRFTSRDQLSFSTVRDRVLSKAQWSVGMFMDCERRSFVVQAYHRDVLLEHMAFVPPPPPIRSRPVLVGVPPPPPIRSRPVVVGVPSPPPPPTRRGGGTRRARDRRRHRKAAAGVAVL